MSLSIKQVKNYKKWGWDAWILKNDWVTIAAIPEIGGRIMEYALGKTSLIYVNPELLGITITPNLKQEWPNFGGYKVWPAPQDSWKWPPPPILDHGIYHAEIEAESEASVTLLMKSEIEKWQTPGIRIERRITLKSNSTKASIRETLVNEGKEDLSWSIWDVTQQIVNHMMEEDYDKFWVYFPLNPKSKYGASGVSFTGPSDAWRGEVEPGVYGVQCHLDGEKIFTDSHKGWIACSDLGRQIATTKTFSNYHGKSYPDNEARMAVYLNTNELPYLEVEVMGPIVELAPGETSSFTIDWGITHAAAPVVDVNETGVISAHLSYANGKLTGRYGVFTEGSIYLVFRDLRGVMLKKTLPEAVSPQKPIQFVHATDISEDVRLIEVQINGMDGHLLGVLDALEIIPEK